MPSLSLNLLRRESPATIVREAWWRVRRSYLKRQFARRDFNRGCPVRFRPLGYYDRLQRLGSGADSSPLIDYADALCRGEFRFLGHADAKLGLPPSWSLDFVSGKRWPQVSADRVVLIAGDGSDVKVPWELSRLQFLPGWPRHLLDRRRPLPAMRARSALRLDRTESGRRRHSLDGSHGGGAARREHLPDA